MPSRNRPPIKTYEARSRIGLKLKIKQEAGLSKVVHNTALDPVHQPLPVPAPAKGAEPPPRSAPPSLPPATQAQMNGTLDHPPPAARKPTVPAPCPRLPLRKTYRENVGDPGAAEGAQGRPRGASSPTSLPAKVDEATSGLIRELAAVEDELYQRVLKGGHHPQETPASTPARAPPNPAGEAPALPPAKTTQVPSPLMWDQASSLVTARRTIRSLSICRAPSTASLTCNRPLAGHPQLPTPIQGPCLATPHPQHLCTGQTPFHHPVTTVASVPGR
ncbi:BRD4-interacting chromatin-remodeling complex-associated protein-like [Arvicola amphibius]|uniref:BRD4-interacting chromatin-remodeling complex-associated protein-like n=1 Tax=Arvicola amphibius TaxID=1047088 RepID=UPI0018E2B7BE|nr:BRD4-interacting chromatin-remodeling complex-associated protein-like [Arvicola amphibius]